MKNKVALVAVILVSFALVQFSLASELLKCGGVERSV